MEDDRAPTGSSTRYKKTDDASVDDLRRELFLKDPRTMDKQELESIRRALGVPGRKQGGPSARAQSDAEETGVPKPHRVGDPSDLASRMSPEKLAAARQARADRIAERQSPASGAAPASDDDAWYEKARTEASRLSAPPPRPEPHAPPAAMAPAPRSNRAAGLIGVAAAAAIVAGGLVALSGGMISIDDFMPSGGNTADATVLTFTKDLSDTTTVTPFQTRLAFTKEISDTTTVSPFQTKLTFTRELSDTTTVSPFATKSAGADPVFEPVAPVQTVQTAAAPDAGPAIRVPGPNNDGTLRPLKPVLVTTLARPNNEWRDLITATEVALRSASEETAQDQKLAGLSDSTGSDDTRLVPLATGNAADPDIVAAALKSMTEQPSTAPADNGNITVAARIIGFDEPVVSEYPHLNGKTIAEIITTSTPQYAPIEGLPEDVWKTRQCKDCHTWTKADLCQQGKHYLTPVGAPALNRNHPLDGFKQLIRDWAGAGCS
ncbi:hypothetical protein [Amaricoccus tamworthensis]|uniref:hypothetical protein n=1 Tax=Amaricoccus tamworthensis TaxID=57002 RepID=UPI003C7AAEE2